MLQRRRPLESVAELLQWDPHTAEDSSLDLRQSSVQLVPPSAELSTPVVMLCHDFAGGYNSGADERYMACFNSWGSIDEFCYFAHTRVSIPPLVWIEQCHKNRVPCFGTLITEHECGIKENTKLLDSTDECVAILSQMLVHYGFDGWLINIESPLQHGAADVPRLARFLSLLRKSCRAAVPWAKVVVYDSINAEGQLGWADELYSGNLSQFEACDGIFLNYWWTVEKLNRSARLAGDQARNVYVGIDVYGRGSKCHGKGPLCAPGVAMAAEEGLSIALFAPGWVLESGPGANCSAEEAAVHDEEFWTCLDTARVREGHVKTQWSSGSRHMVRLAVFAGLVVMQRFAIRGSIRG